MTDFDQLSLMASERGAARRERVRAIAADADADPISRLAAERDLLRLQISFARSFMELLTNDARRPSDLVDEISVGRPADRWPCGLEGGMDTAATMDRHTHIDRTRRLCELLEQAV